MTNNSKSISNWPQLFTGSAEGQDGSEGCLQTGAPYNGNWTEYFTATENSISITAGDDARTVSTDNNLNFNLGTGGVTQISFDFEITNYMNTSGLVTWLAFWIYSNPWSGTVEVDFIESLNGPGGQNNGLNSNFAGQGNQVIIYDSSFTGPWTGSIIADFTSLGDNQVAVRVSNSVNSNVATATLTNDSGYFFVLDTCSSTPASGECVITISNLQYVGEI